MQVETVKLLAEAAVCLEITGVSVKEQYSGPGMYGKVTTGLVLPKLVTLAALVAQAVLVLMESGREDVVKCERLINEMKRLSWDAFGRDVVVY